MSKWSLFLMLVLFTAGSLNAQDTVAVRVKVKHKISTVFKADLKWGAGGSEEGMFLNPKAICVDASDNVYVLDNGNNRVQKFDSDGKFIESFDKFEPTNKNDLYRDFKIADAKSLAVDKDGNFFFMTVYSGFGYFADQKLNFVYATGGDTTAGYAVSRNGFLYSVSSANGGCVIKRTRKSKLVVEYPDNAPQPTGIAVDSQGNVYVLQTGYIYDDHFGIQKYSPGGDPLIRWGKPGDGENQYMGLTGIAIDGEDHIYVLGANRSRVEVYTPDGKPWNKFGDYGIGLGQMRDPNAIAVNSRGQVYVLDAGNNRVQRFTRNRQDTTISIKGKILKTTDTPLLDILAKVTITYDPQSDEAAVDVDAPQPMKKPDVAGDVAKKVLGL